MHTNISGGLGNLFKAICRRTIKYALVCDFAFSCFHLFVGSIFSGAFICTRIAITIVTLTHTHPNTPMTSWKRYLGKKGKLDSLFRKSSFSLDVCLVRLRLQWKIRTYTSVLNKPKIHSDTQVRKINFLSKMNIVCDGKIK